MFGEDTENGGAFAHCGMGGPESTEEKRGAGAGNSGVWDQEKENTI